MFADEEIEVGDYVKVEFERSVTIFKAEVLHIPSATGECWHLRDVSGSKIKYVQLFSVMELLETAAWHNYLQSDFVKDARLKAQERKEKL